jgi:type VI secretion system protein ImpA
MTTDPLLEIDALLEPIPGDYPAGEPLPFEIRAQLEDMRVDRTGADVPPEEEHRADWAGIIRLAQATLVESSKDLLVGARLTEAMVKQYGFAGLRDSLKLLRRLVAECWDRLNPPIEDGDVEVRTAPFNWLDSADRGARFPSTLRMVPLVYGETGAFGWLDWRAIQEGRAPADRVDDFEKAIQNTRYQEGQQLVEDIGEARTELTSLLSALNEKMGGSAPGLSEVRGALEECNTLAQQILRKLPPPVEAVVAGNGAVANGAGGPAAAPGAGGGAISAAGIVATRDGAYRQIEQSALLLKQLEPHSPIPYLILRAVELGKMPFPELMRALIRNNDVVTELSRELGIKEGASGGQSSGASSSNDGW